MVTRLTKPKSLEYDPPSNNAVSTRISAPAKLAWGRIPSRFKTEIIAAVEQRSPDSDASTKIVKVGSQLLKVRNVASGFRVIYEPGEDGNTIVSVLTPREVRLAKG
ncbi:hypothetical protein [Duganella sp. FT27W]|uniref:hypothetical protein n=1 Tax=Duganella sp. FT27W TaxID=2654636 RepID=UPI00128B378F|nr:hypothetical protein [Duganella sp. FT27W]MPQ55370.1 hypothetical protein [Duganella sp. FT27W]